MSLGFVQAGFRPIGAVDHDEWMNRTYETNIGIKPQKRDLSKVTPRALPEILGVKRGELDVLVACPPCQGFSQHNRYNGKDDPRDSLLSLSADFCTELRPEFFVTENVPQILRGAKTRYFERLLEVLKREHYNVIFDVHNAYDYGVPQRRYRALAIARRDNLPVELPRPSGEHLTVRDTISELPPLKSGASDSGDSLHRGPKHTKRIIEMISKIPHNGGSWADIDSKYWLPCMKNSTRKGAFCDVYGRMRWDRPASTITAKSSTPSCGRYVHPEQNRGISIREAALLQSFPRTWRAVGPFAHCYRQVGEAVPPKMSNAIARKIIELKSSLALTPFLAH